MMRDGCSYADGNLNMYLINKTRLKAERYEWQLFNLFLPVALVVVGGILFFYLRRRKYYV